MNSNARACVVVAIAALSVACNKQPGASPAPSAVERGAYLATVGGCHDCHSPKVLTANGPAPDPKRLLSGHPADSTLPTVAQGVLGPQQWGALATNDLTAWAGPWGVSYAANLTPDPTGLGNWTEATFVQAIRSGKHAGIGRPILPPMPWEDYARMTDDDLHALFAYLRSMPPVKNSVPEPTPPPTPLAPQNS
jgi:hypothetical protein